MVNRMTILAKLMSFLYWIRSYYRKTFFRKNGYSYSVCSLEAEPPLILGQIWGRFSERALKRSHGMRFCAALFWFPSYEPVYGKKCWNRPNLTFDDLWLPGLWPDLKKVRSSFVTIFDALSNAAYRVSLRGPGAELEGAITDPPPSGEGK